MIAKRIIRDDWWKVVAYTAVLLLNMGATIGAYPTFQANIDQITNLLPDVFKPIREALVGVGTGGLPTFLSINHLFKGANMIGPAMAIVLALGTIVREVETGTIAILLSRPVGRIRVLLTIMATHLVEMLVPLFLVSALAPMMARAFIDESLAYGPMLQGTLHAAVFIVAVYGIALAFSVWFSEQIKVAAATGGICVVSFLLYFIDATRPFTLYNLSSLELYSAVARGNGLSGFEIASCLAIAAGSVGVAGLVFRTRNY